jgi:DNA-binding NarL/FixJ family response regulator
MKTPGPIWVDERNPIYRRGLVACLRGEGYTIAGESAAFRPPPHLSTISLLIFDVDAAGAEGVAALTRYPDLLLIGLVREVQADRMREVRAANLPALLLLRTLTPSRLLACVDALTAGDADAPGEILAATTARAHRGDRGHLTPRELDVLALLAEGGSTRDIAVRLSYSERTVKNIVHDVLTKLNGRTRAQAVAVAARRGMI